MYIATIEQHSTNEINPVAEIYKYGMDVKKYGLKDVLEVSEKIQMFCECTTDMHQNNQGYFFDDIKEEWKDISLMLYSGM